MNWFPFLFHPPCRPSTDELRKCSMCCLTSTAEEQAWVDVEFVSVFTMLFYERCFDEYFTAHLYATRPLFPWLSPILSVPVWVGFWELPACKSGLGDAWSQIRLWGCQGQPCGQKGQWAKELYFKSMQAASSSWFKSKPLRSSVALKFFTVIVYPLLASINLTLCTEQFTDMCCSFSLWSYFVWR